MSLDTEYQIDTSVPGIARLSGVMRLVSVAAYERPLAPVQDALTKANPFTLDLSGLTFLNSSGIRALANLVLLARQQSRGLLLKGSARVPWQKKTLASLQLVYPQLQVQLD